MQELRAHNDHMQTCNEEVLLLPPDQHSQVLVVQWTSLLWECKVTGCLAIDGLLGLTASADDQESLEDTGGKVAAYCTLCGLAVVGTFAWL